MATILLIAPAAAWAQTPPQVNGSTGAQSGVVQPMTPATPQATGPTPLTQPGSSAPQMLPPQVPQTLQPGQTGGGQVPNGLPAASGQAGSNQK